MKSNYVARGTCIWGIPCIFLNIYFLKFALWGCGGRGWENMYYTQKKCVSNVFPFRKCATEFNHCIHDVPHTTQAPTLWWARHPSNPYYTSAPFIVISHKNTWALWRHPMHYVRNKHPYATMPWKSHKVSLHRFVQGKALVTLMHT